LSSWIRKYTKIRNLRREKSHPIPSSYKALYGKLQSALLFCKKLIKDLATIGFKTNPYDPCVANRMVKGKQPAVTWHVDDLKSSHVNPKVNDDFLIWLEKQSAQSRTSRKISHSRRERSIRDERARQDIQPGIAFLCTRVQHPTEDDWKKLRRMIQF
jgi:hypothetical protein